MHTLHTKSRCIRQQYMKDTLTQNQKREKEKARTKRAQSSELKLAPFFEEGLWLCTFW